MNSLNRMCENNAVENFIQGTFWRSRLCERRGKTVIPIFLFFDDYEIGNALGSRAGQHKLGAVYASIPCLPPCRASALKNIFLLLLFHSSDRVLFGNNIIFRCVIDELNYLSEHGIEFDLPVFKGIIYFELGLILGDNLGIHAITGFVESFSANYSCRICKVSKQVLRSQCIENKDILRNFENYQNDLLCINPSETGIKEKCIWLDVIDFDLFNQVGVDCMHDILEGVAKYVMQFVLLQCIRRFKFFTLTQLNNKIHAFEYGPDCRNQPCSFSMENLIRSNVRQSASEMLTLLRYFGLLVGESVPRENEIWDLYLKLRIVLEIILSSAFARGTGELLQTAVKDLNTLYLSLTKDSLKPKFHNLIHYHTALEKYGPIVSLWCMRFEAKHRVFKMASNVSCNRKNITLSLTTKHQLQLNELFLTGKLPDTLRTGPAVRVSYNDSDIKQLILSTMQLCDDRPLVHVTWATVSSTRYVKGTILIYDTNTNDSLPEFLRVNNVYLYDSNDLIFVGTLMQTLRFDDHFFAYEVGETETNQNVIKRYKSLVSPIPCNINVLNNGKKYITVRCAL
ncbi:unnamed protein product [Diatraea saccharalis]|uniref:Uncharacterized protein n=1 Tax=Diatraea saccharalis TaxID=40085 RepID=A0A9N9N0K0_9NEOP|nr:unnamed protein product [Diatraea saccharalis]